MVAVRDADYAAMTWWPEVDGLDDWLALYRAVAHGNDAEPDAGRRLRAWCRAAGFTDLDCTASVWTYADAEERRWWGHQWAERSVGSAFARQAVRAGSPPTTSSPGSPTRGGRGPTTRTAGSSFPTARCAAGGEVRSR